MSVVVINGLLQYPLSTWRFGACCVPVAQEEVVEVEVAPEAEAQVKAEPEIEPEPEPEPEPQEVVHEEEGTWHGQYIHPHDIRLATRQSCPLQHAAKHILLDKPNY